MYNTPPPIPHFSEQLIHNRNNILLQLTLPASSTSPNVYVYFPARARKLIYKQLQVEFAHFLRTHPQYYQPNIRGFLHRYTAASSLSSLCAVCSSHNLLTLSVLGDCFRRVGVPYTRATVKDGVVQLRVFRH